MNEPCARGLPGRDGKLCPDRAHAPRALEGALAWDLLTRGAGQWRFAGLGRIAGLDLEACLARARRTDPAADPAIMQELLLAGEAGALAAFARAAADAAEANGVRGA